MAVFTYPINVLDEWLRVELVSLEILKEREDVNIDNNYDFSIIFESVENRKKLHDMDRKYTQEVVEYE